MSTNKDDETSAAGSLSRRALVRSGGLLAGAAIGAPVIRALAQPPKPPAPPAVADSAVQVVPDDATKVPGMASESLGGRSTFERPALTPTGVTSGSSLTPHHAV
jgi:hypothetical protein